MKYIKILPAMLLDLDAYHPIDLGGLAVNSLSIQCRSSDDIYLSNTPVGTDYWSLRAGAAFIFSPEGGMMQIFEGSELISGGEFASAAEFALWTCDLDDWTYDAVSFNVDKDADGVTTLSQVITAEVDGVYKLVYTLVECSVGSVTASIGGTSGIARSTAGTFTEYIIAADTTSGLVFTPTNTSRFTIDTISVKKITYPLNMLPIYIKGTTNNQYLEILMLS